MAAVERRKFPFASRYPDLADWLEGLPVGLPFSSGEHFIRIEETEEDGTYVVRAELPGLDPDRDIEITVDEGTLTIHAERSEQKIEEAKGKRRSEFRYGSFTRSVSLPRAIKEEDVRASYDKGLLTVRAPLREVSKASRRIEVHRAS